MRPDQPEGPSDSTLRLVAGGLGLGATSLASLVPVWAAATYPSYDPVSQYISELAARDVPNGTLVAAAGFLPIGLFVLAFCHLAGRLFDGSRQARTGFLLVSLVGVSYAFSGFVPCDPGCAGVGSVSQVAHLLLASLQYLGFVAGAIVLAALFRGYSRLLANFTLVCAAVSAAAIVLAVLPDNADWRGALQRLAEGAIFVWIGVVAIVIAGSRTEATPEPE